MVVVCGLTQKAIFMNVNLPEHRGSIFSVNNLFDSLDKGIGPAVGSAILAATDSRYSLPCSAVSGDLFTFLLILRGPANQIRRQPSDKLVMETKKATV